MSDVKHDAGMNEGAAGGGRGGRFVSLCPGGTRCFWGFFGRRW